MLTLDSLPMNLSRPWWPNLDAPLAKQKRAAVLHKLADVWPCRYKFKQDVGYTYGTIETKLLHCGCRFAGAEPTGLLRENCCVVARPLARTLPKIEFERLKQLEALLGARAYRALGGPHRRGIK